MTTITIDGLVIDSMESAKRVGFSIAEILMNGGTVELTDPLISVHVDHEFFLNSGIPYEKMMGTLIKQWRNEK